MKNTKRSKKSLFLNAAVLALMLILIIILSVIQTTRNLQSQSPQKIHGWIFIEENGEKVKKNFEGETLMAVSVAQIIDQGQRISYSSSTEKMGEFTITFASGRKNIFDLNVQGVLRRDGFNWQYQVSPEEILKKIGF
ncbi:MAG: hypothetical protein Q4C96_09855 [Planctomycetia bacterium]|nr:hypothetical protein [Planctomycetia bacterium]